jgi:hypothetical protein
MKKSYSDEPIRQDRLKIEQQWNVGRRKMRSGKQKAEVKTVSQGVTRLGVWVGMTRKEALEIFR